MRKLKAWKVYLLIAMITTPIAIVIFTWESESETIIFAFYDSGTSSFTIDLKKNGRYVISNNSWLTSTEFKGNYSLNDSIITLDKNKIDKVILTNTLQLDICPYYKLIDNKRTNVDSVKKCLLQIDEVGNPIDTHYGFIVRLDNRKKQNR